MLKVSHIIGPAPWVGYLVNGDATGLSADDVASADVFAEWAGGHIVAADVEFYAAIQIGDNETYRGDCIEYTVHSQETYFACIAIGQADFMPDTQDYISAPTPGKLAALVATYCEQFDNARDGDTYKHDFRAPSSPTNTNWSQRVRIEKEGDCVMVVIGMCEADYMRESA